MGYYLCVTIVTLFKETAANTHEYYMTSVLILRKPSKPGKPLSENILVLTYVGTSAEVGVPSPFFTIMARAIDCSYS